MNDFWDVFEISILQQKNLCLLCEKKEKTSQYKGVYWHSQTGRWYVSIRPKGQNRKYCGSFKDELDAAKRVNQFCEDVGIPLRNPEISAMTNQQYQVTTKYVLPHEIVRNPNYQN